jgi:hypothetical protein
VSFPSGAYQITSSIYRVLCLAVKRLSAVGMFFDRSFRRSAGGVFGTVSWGGTAK